MGQIKCPRIRLFKLDPASVVGQNGAEPKLKSPNTKKHASSRRTQTKESVSLPKGLIGAKCTAQVTINDHTCNSLLDSGSQVTTVSQSFYEEYLSHLPVHSLNDLLEVEGANGQSVPYLGYIEITITFPKSSIGADIEVPTLALIVPNVSSNSPSLLIGTNTLDTLYEQYEQNPNLGDQHSLSYGYKILLKTLATRKKCSFDLSLGEVRLHSTECETIGARQTKVLGESVTCRMPDDGNWVAVEASLLNPLPGGLLVIDGLATLPSKLSPSYTNHTQK